MDRILIHYQPRPRENLILGVPLQADRHTVSGHFGEAPYFRLISINRQDGRTMGDHLLTNPFPEVAKGKGIKVAQWLLEHKLDVLVARHAQTGKGPGYVLGNAGVEVLLTGETEADKALARAEAELGVKDPGGEGGKKRIEENTVNLTLALKNTGSPFRRPLEKKIRETLLSVSGVDEVRIKVTGLSREEVASLFPRQELQGLKQVDRIIAVASGKGGVGKTTVSVRIHPCING